jgi:hypothetical protein
MATCTRAPDFVKSFHHAKSAAAAGIAKTKRKMGASSATE